MLANLKSRDGDADNVNDKLRQLCRQMLSSLNVLSTNEPGDLHAAEKAQQLAKVQLAMERLSSADLPDRCTRITNRWRLLSSEALQARHVLLQPADGASASEVFVQNYTIRLDRDSDFVVAYWQNLASALLDSLAQSANLEARQKIVAQISDAQHFPLVLPDSRGGDTELTPEQLSKVKSALKELTQSGAARPTVTVDKDPLAPLATLKSLEQYSAWLTRVGTRAGFPA